MTTVPALASRDWVPDDAERYIQDIAADAAGKSPDAIEALIAQHIAGNRAIHERDCVNLNPATNVMNPRAEAALASGLGSRPSLGYPGDKYEMGLESIEKIEVIAAELAAEVFGARYAEIRVPSGAIANLYAFMATARPGDRIIAPPGSIGGHVTHHQPGAAGLYGLEIHAAPVDPQDYTVDVEAARPGQKASAEADHHRLQPEPLPAPDPPHPRHRRRGRRPSVVRRRAYVGHDRRPCLAAAAGGGRASDDDEHLQEPRRPALGPDPDQ